MPAAARVGDMTDHMGTIVGPGAATVLIGGKPAAVAGDLHVCGLPFQGHPLTSSTCPLGSMTVLAGGKPLVRVGDVCLCGASAAVGEPTVMVG